MQDDRPVTPTLYIHPKEVLDLDAYVEPSPSERGKLSRNGKDRRKRRNKAARLARRATK